MRPRGTMAIVGSWVGIAAAAVVLACAAWLATEYILAVRATPVEDALVKSLKERAVSDATIHPTLLQPEYDRQRLALERRLTIYRRGGLALLVSLGVFFAWIKWLKSGQGELVGIPSMLATPIALLSAGQQSALAFLRKRPKRKVKKGVLAAAAAARPPAAKRSSVRFIVLDSCSGCTVCAQVCPVNAIEARPYKKHWVIDNRCTRCGLCLPACPEQSIEVR